MGLGFSASDVQNFVSRLLQYLVTSPPRRATELQNQSAYDFFIGRQADGTRRFYYSSQFEKYLLEMPKVLAAFDARWGDARTNLTTYLQLQLQMDRRDNKADGVLNGPTTESWFDHWYRHLVQLGRGSVESARYVVDHPAERGAVARGSTSAQCVASPPWRIPGAPQLGRVRRHVDQDLHPNDVNGGRVRIGPPRR